MNTLRIGVMDKETQYVERLCRYLNRSDNRIWNASAFTDKKILKKYMDNRRVDILLTTEPGTIEEFKTQYPERCYVWLTEKKSESMTEENKIHMIYRYQSAKMIVDSLKDIVEYTGLVIRSAKVSAVMYSPIGRCGKTKLAKAFVDASAGGRWLYIGMEDYGGADDKSYVAEDFLYYVKERSENEIMEIISGCEGYIPSPFSVFDMRRLCREDIEWFLKIFEKENMYRGVMFDMGTALIGSFDMMLPFDHIIIPVLYNDNSDKKIKHFEELINVYEFNELNEKMHLMDMNKNEELIGEMKRLLM